MENGLKIIELSIQNIKGIIRVSFKPDSPVVEITGKNGAGKSSVLDAFALAMGGSKFADALMLRAGATKGSVKVNLSDRYTVERILTPTGMKLKVETKAGIPVQSPQKFLNEMFQTISFDPVAFSQLAEDKQKSTLLGMVDLGIDIDRILDIASECVAVTEFDDGLETLKEVEQDLYNERRAVNKELKKLEAHADSIEIPAGMENAEAVNVTDLFAERKALETKQAAKVDKEKEFERIRGQSENYVGKIEDIRQSIIELEEELAETEKLKAALDKGGYILLEEIQAMPDIDFTEIDARIIGADKITAAASKVNEKERTAVEVEAAQVKHEELDQHIQEIRDYRAERLAAAKFPVDGLGIDEEGRVFFNSIPLAQVNTAQKILVGCAIAAAGDPKLRVVMVRDGNVLDKESMDVLKKWAGENDFMVMLEHVAEESTPGAFFIEEGVLKE